MLSITIQQAKSRSGYDESLIAMLNSMATANVARMSIIVIELSNISKEVIGGMLQLNIGGDVSLNFKVMAPSGAYISEFVSAFNMAVAHCCKAIFESSQNIMRITFYPPSPEVERKIENFFNLLSSLSSLSV